ncbi:MAG TPA: hypothetical protein VEL76_40420 [Gemmataceae bacterium]|nr:hypothetical protein [Gemmataceae bacterium]
MPVVLAQALAFVIRSAAVAAGILLVGGAVKKVLQDPPDECLEQGKHMAGLFTGTGKLLPPASGTTSLLRN